MRWPLFVLIGLTVTLLACGSQEEADALVAVTISSPVEMPFHGPSGPGTEPMYIGFSWTVVVTASGGPESQVGMVRTQLTERRSGAVLVAEGGPLGTLAGGGRLELVQQASGFFASSLYPGDWTGVSTIEVSHMSGKTGTLTASFAFK